MIIEKPRLIHPVGMIIWIVIAVVGMAVIGLDASSVAEFGSSINVQ